MKNAHFKTQCNAFAIVALFLFSASNSTLAATTGKIIVRNRTNQTVTVVSNYWTPANGNKIFKTLTWKFQPGEAATLVHGGKTIEVSAFAYELKTTEGRTPTSGKVWVYRFVNRNGFIEVGIRPDDLAPISAATRNKNIRNAKDMFAKRGFNEDVVRFAHPSCKMTSFKYLNTYDVVSASGDKKPGHFAIAIEYNWIGELFEDRGFTQLMFFLMKLVCLTTSRWTKTPRAFEPSRHFQC